MACPDFQSLTLPALQMLAAGGDLTSASLREKVAALLGLSEADIAELVPSGHQPRFNNRMHWAANYLTAAGLTQWVKRGTYRITDRGRGVVATPPSRIDIPFLMQFPEFAAWRRRDGSGTDAAATAQPPTEALSPEAATPEEQIDAGHQTLRRKVQGDLIDRILAASSLSANVSETAAPFEFNVEGEMAVVDAQD